MDDVFEELPLTLELLSVSTEDSWTKLSVLVVVVVEDDPNSDILM